MKTTFAVVLLLLAAATALAQQPAPAPASEEPPKIDASPDKLLELFAEAEEPPEPPKRVEFHAGRIDVRAFGTSFRIGYLPFMMPFVGARLANTKEWPDAFSMLGVQIPNTPQTFRRSREMNAELRRIERTEKIKATIQINP